MFGLGVPELLIILAVVLLLFGGARIAGLGKSTGRALREFKEETKSLKAEEADNTRPAEPYRPETVQQPPAQPPAAPPAGPQSYPQAYPQPYPQANPPSEPPINTAWQQPPAGNVQDAPSGEVRKDS